MNDMAPIEKVKTPNHRLSRAMNLVHRITHNGWFYNPVLAISFLVGGATCQYLYENPKEEMERTDKLSLLMNNLETENQQKGYVTLSSARQFSLVTKDDSTILITGAAERKASLDEAKKEVTEAFNNTYSHQVSELGYLCGLSGGAGALLLIAAIGSGITAINRKVQRHYATAKKNQNMVPASE